MKKLCVLLCLVFISSMMLPCTSFASSASVEDSNTVYYYLDDGSYIVSTLYVEIINNDGISLLDTVEPYYLRAQRYATCHDKNDELDWTVTLTGVFYVDPAGGESGMCESSELSAEIYDTSWGMYDVDERCMANNAYGACNMKDKFLGITTHTVSLEMILTCDRYGNITVLGEPTS